MMKNNLFLLALATLLLVSCNKDKGNHLEDDDNVVQITASIDGHCRWRNGIRGACDSR